MYCIVLCIASYIVLKQARHATGPSPPNGFGQHRAEPEAEDLPIPQLKGEDKNPGARFSSPKHFVGHNFGTFQTFQSCVCILAMMRD